MNDTEIGQALGTAEPQVNTDDALARFRARVQSEGIAGVTPVAHRRIASRWLQGLAAAAGVVLVASALTLSGAADPVLTVLGPKSVVRHPTAQREPTDQSPAGARTNL